MTNSNGSTGPTQPQSPLSEAVEQAAAAARMWCDEITDVIKYEADRLSSGSYGLNDLVTGPVQLMRSCVRNAVKMAFVASDNLALLSYARPGSPPPSRVVKVRVGIPANVSGKLTASDMIGQLHACRIPSSNIRLTPDEPPPEAETRDIAVAVEVDFPRAPSDIYEGRLDLAGTVSVLFWVAFDEPGQPVG